MGNFIPPIESIADQLTQGADQNDTSADISEMMHSLTVAAMTGTAYAPPIESPQPRTVQKVTAPAPWTPEITITPAPLAKRANHEQREYLKRSLREKIRNGMTLEEILRRTREIGDYEVEVSILSVMNEL
jgi:hypothetical protein